MRAGRPQSQEKVTLLNPGIIYGCRSLPGFLASELILWIRLRKTQKRRAAKPPGAVCYVRLRECSPRPKVVAALDAYWSREVERLRSRGARLPDELHSLA